MPRPTRRLWRWLRERAKRAAVRMAVGEIERLDEGLITALWGFRG